MYRISVRCVVECDRCGWKSQRSLHVLEKSVKKAERNILGTLAKLSPEIGRAHV
jgi:Zn ribbon nucleic-acid-binding protein